MDIKQFFQAFYNRGFNKIDAYKLIGQIAVETDGFKKKAKWAGTIKLGRHELGVTWLNDDNGGKFYFNDMKESVAIITNTKLKIRED